ncbi:T9SS type A sorting domain-containing protein [bacterium]|nr:T9SS type A sorting domain-containing protein [bacterium]
MKNRVSVIFILLVTVEISLSGRSTEVFAETDGTVTLNRALKLTQSGDYVEIPHDASLSPANITMECWLNMNGEVGEQSVIEKRDTNGGYQLRIVGNTYPLGVAVVIKDTEETILVVNHLIKRYTWTHLAATYDGSVINLYVNEDLSGSKNSNKDITGTSRPLRIGEYGGYPPGSFGFHGLIDDLRVWNTARSEAEIESNMNATISGNESHLIGYWKFDETGPTCTDAGSNQNHGLLQGSAGTVPSTAPIDQEAANHAMQLNHQGAMVEIPHAGTLAPSHITLECWIKKNTNLSYEYTIADKRGNGSGYNLRLAGTAFPLGLYIFFDGNGSSVGAGSGNCIHANTWVHIAATYDGSTACLYLDGELIASGAGGVDISQSISSLRIGELQGFPNASLNFFGDIDEFRIWNYARSQAEIKAAMHENLSALEAGLIGYWRFNEAAGSVAYDKSESENHGVISANASFIESGAPVGFVPPQKPVGFRAIGTDNLVTLHWKAGDPTDIDHTIIYRDEDRDFEPAPENVIATVDQAVTTFPDASLSNGEQRYYCIKSVDFEGHSSQPSPKAAGKPAEIFENYLTGVYYYPWYGGTWGHSWPGSYVRNYLDPAQTPVLGEYDSRDRSVIRQHLDWCNQYDIDLWVCSWWGVHSRENTTIKDYIMPELTTNDVQFALFYESAILGALPWEIDSDSEAKLIEDYTYIANTYFDHPNYFKINDRHVVYIYLSHLYQGDYIGAFAHVRQAMSDLGYDLYLVGDEMGFGMPTDHMNFLDAVTAYNMLGAQDYGIETDFFGLLGTTFSSWEKAADDRDMAFIPVAVTGFNNRSKNKTSPGNSIVVPRQSTEGAGQTSYFEEYIKAGRPYVDSDLKLMMITSWNEWHEDTQIEPLNAAPPTNQDIGGTTYTNGYYYEGYGMNNLEVVQDLLASGTSPVVKSIHPVPVKYVILQNYPNPFNPATMIIYHIKEPCQLSLRVYNTKGQEIETLVSEFQGTGKYSVNFDASGLTSGIYFYQLQSDKKTIATEKMILLK